MKILAIETSCDETAVAILEGPDLAVGESKEKERADREVKLLANVVSSQVAIHAPWGGVVPNLAAREHLKNLPVVFQEALDQAQLKLTEVDYLAVTQGPGLIPALVLGVNFTKALSYTLQKPLLGIHHIEGHLYANLLPARNKKESSCHSSAPPAHPFKKLKFPVVALVVSGGHTQLILMRDHLQYQILGQTQDDAAGEAFDKVAKLLDLGYPGGPLVSAEARKFRQLKEGNSKQISQEMLELEFPRPMLNKKNLDFSFSGLKTAVSYFWKKIESRELREVELKTWKQAVCWAFEEAVTEVLVIKSFRATQKQQAKTFLLSGGVAANGRLREGLESALTEKMPANNLLLPELRFCGDNAAMIARAAYQRIIKTQEEKKSKNSLSKKEAVWKENWKNLEASASLELI